MQAPAVGSYELLCRANRLNEELGMPGGARAITTRLVAVSKSTTVRTSDGYDLCCHARLAEVRRPDLVLVPAFDGPILEQLELNRMVVPWLRSKRAAGATLASICTGAFALAEAGLLDGVPATTHWAAQDLFRSRYPRTIVRPQDTIVDAGPVITSGGAYSFVNLVLYLVDKLLGREVAERASRVCLVDVNKAPQGSYADLSARKNHTDKTILRVQGLIEDKLAEDLTVARLAAEIRLSRRQLLRRFKEATGMPPSEYLQCVRVEAAKKALTGSREPLDEVAWTVGYTDVPGFRKAFARLTGLTPSEYRRRNRISWQTAPA